jgi:uncharacterized membrane protein
MSKFILPKLILYILVPLQLLIFTFLVPTFQKPDEQPHFEKALIISKGYIFCNKKINNTVFLEKKYIDLIKTPYLDLLTHGKNKLPIPIFISSLVSNKQNNKLVHFNVDHLCSFPIVSYLPQAITLCFLSLIRINPIQSIYFVRFIMGILCYFWFLYLYKKITDNYKLILLFTFALPMTLHQICSFSYDSMHIMLALTIFSLISNNLQDKKYSIPASVGMTQSKIKYICLFFILFLFLASKKIGYETFFLFLFLLPLELKPTIILSLIFIPLYFLSKLSGSYDLNYSLTISKINPLFHLNFLLSNPINIFSVLTLTTLRRFTFYLQSLIGIFGWLEYGLDPLSYFFYGLFFVFVIVKTNHALSLFKNKKILLFVALIFSYIYILLLAFFFNTAPGQIIIHGVQGRYFIPFVPFIILFITQFTKNINWPIIRVGKRTKNIFYLIIISYLIIATFWSVYSRYY